ncbi:MAG: hypothetical protein J5634_01415 [Bacilli bacterium]|nr:hypothetical protein [Bacilli bacterium]
MKEDFKLKNIYDKYRENKNSHVYLVETNSITQAIEDIKKLIILINEDAESNIEPLILNESLPTLMIIGPKVQEILTEDIDRLIVMLQKIPVITKDNYFIIHNAEKLNKKSGNQMLKIIEEPETDMLGFFVCNSTDGIMPTISSRTQTISLIYDTEEIYEEDLISDAQNYLNELHDKASLIVNKKYIDKYKDIDQFKIFVECIISIQKKYINTQTNFDIIKKESLLLSKLYDLISKISGNCNINLLMDKFLIEVSRL